jgi:hypothetical protein
MSLLTIGHQFPAYRLTALIGGADPGGAAAVAHPKMTGFTEASNA